MNKIYKPITGCNAGEILAEDVNNKKGTILLVKNTIINDFIKNKLTELGIKKIRIYDQQDDMLKEDGLEKQDENYNHECINQNYAKMLNTLKYLLQKITKNSLEYNELKLITDEMFSYINDINSIVQCLSNMRMKDEYTYHHSINVAFYAMLTAKWLDLPDYMIKDLITAGLLHDVGKVKIPIEVLNKTGKLTVEEYDVIKMHSQLGYDMLKDIPEMAPGIAIAVLQHHERIDGSGYPLKLVDQQISLYAKIIAICDVFDAMTQNRIYKSKVTPFDAFEMFLTTGLCSFDTHVLTTFLKHMSLYYIGTEVILNNRKEGEIVYIPPQDILFPIIKIGADYIDLSQETNLKILDLA
jgi:putative nucleotidyltransferase with HDIG domain